MSTVLVSLDLGKVAQDMCSGGKVSDELSTGCVEIIKKEVDIECRHHQERCLGRSAERSLLSSSRKEDRSIKTGEVVTIIPESRYNYGVSRSKRVPPCKNPTASSEMRKDPSSSSKIKMSSVTPPPVLSFARSKFSTCKLCSFPMSGLSRFKVAHHLYQEHYRHRILSRLSHNQKDCEICGKSLSSRNVARHLGVTHGVAIEMYLKDVGEREKVHKSVDEMRDEFSRLLDGRVRSLEKPKTCIETEKKNFRRLRVSKYSRQGQEHLMGRKRTVVEVMVINEAPAVIDLKTIGMVEEKECSEGVIENPLSLQLSSRLLVHGRNSVAWKVVEEEYSECGMDWIRKDVSRNINEFEDLTVGEKQYFCLWNQFMFEKGYVGIIGNIHMDSVLVHFVEEMGRQVVEGNLYR